MSEYKRWDIWMEGYAMNGGHCQASLIGSDEAHSFRDAAGLCLAREGYDLDMLDSERLTFWGCRLFDNEADARKAFG